MINLGHRTRPATSKAWLILMVVLILVMSTTIVNAATVDSNPLTKLKSNSGMKWYDVNLPPSTNQFVGFISDIDKNGKQSVHTFNRPEDLAAVLGVRADQVIPSGTTEESAKLSDQVDKTAQANKTTRPGTVTAMTTHRARIDASAVITDVVYLKLNELYSHHTWDYNGSYVTYETGYSAANWYSPSGWYLYWGPRFYYGPNSLPATSDYAKADAGYRNDM